MVLHNFVLESAESSLICSVCHLQGPLIVTTSTERTQETKQNESKEQRAAGDTYTKDTNTTWMDMGEASTGLQPYKQYHSTFFLNFLSMLYHVKENNQEQKSLGS